MDYSDEVFLSVVAVWRCLRFALRSASSHESIKAIEGVSLVHLDELDGGFTLKSS